MTGKQLGAKLGVGRTTLGRLRREGRLEARICTDLGEWLYRLPEQLAHDRTTSSEILTDHRAVPLVMPFLSDQDNRVKGNAVKYLVKTHPSEVHRALAEMLGSPHVWMRDSAVFLAGKVDLSISEDLLISALSDSSTDIVKKAISSLEVQAKSQAVVDALGLLSRTADESVKIAARKAREAVAKRQS